MKKFTWIFIIGSLVAIISPAQDMNLTFTGINLATETQVSVEKIHVFNLSNGTDTLVNGNTFFMGLTGINNNDWKNEMDIQSYPNPFARETSLVLNSPVDKDVLISAFMLDGREINRYSGNISAGSNRFRLNFIEKGLIILTIQTNTGRSSLKIMCTEPSGRSGIEYLGASESFKNGNRMKNSIEKSYSTDEYFNFSRGHQLRFIAYSGTLQVVSLYDRPITSTNYTVQFSNRNLKIVNPDVFYETPSFVNVNFLVNDQYNNGIDYLSIDDFNIYEDDVLVKTVSQSFYIRKYKQITINLKTTILLDRGSDWGEGFEHVKNSLNRLIEGKLDRQQFAIHSFSNYDDLEIDFTNNTEELVETINSISMGSSVSNLYGSIVNTTYNWIDIIRNGYVEQGQLIVITDGNHTQGSTTLSQVVSSIKDKQVYVIGVGDNINSNDLEMTASPGCFFQVDSPNNLDEAINQIQGRILRSDNSVYGVTYMSSQRTGEHQLKVEIKNNENSESDNQAIGTFSADEFYSVNDGIFFNTTWYQPEGESLIRIDKNNSPVNAVAVNYGSVLAPEFNFIDYSSGSLIIEPDPIVPYSFWFTRGSESGFSENLKIADISNRISQEIPVLFTQGVLSYDEVDICFDSSGEGDTTILLIPGWALPRSYWDEQITSFNKKYRVVSIDLGGHGESGNNREDWTMASYGEDVSAVIDELGLENVIIAGHSMGGAVAIYAALKNPDQVIGIVLCDAIGSVHIATSDATIQNDVYEGLENIGQITPESGEVIFETNQAAFAQRAYDLLNGISLVGLGEGLGSYFHWWRDSLRNDLDQLEIPVLAIKAGPGEGNVTGWREYIPSYKVRIIDGVGHWLNWENPALFNQYLEESIQEILVGN